MIRKYFGTDGIRDVAHHGLLTEPLVRAYGRALGAWLSSEYGASRVLVGRDTRASGPALLEQLAEGIQAFGHTLVDGGVLSTPAVQTLSRAENFAMAVVISASHNPACDNGIKFFGGDGRKLPDATEEALETLVEAPAVPAQGVTPGPRETDAHAAERYCAHLRAMLPELDLTGLTVVLDCAHGAASAFGAEALEQFGAKVVVIGNAPDGTNINDGFGVFSVGNLASLVASQGAAIGMALDGDADRVLLMDTEGTVRDGDHMLGLLGRHLAERGELPGKVIVSTVMANMGLGAYLREFNVRVESVPVGDRHVAAKMSEDGVVLGGEQSGHVIFRDGDAWYGDGLYTGLRVLEVMQSSGRSLAELSRGVVKFPQLLQNVPVKDKPPVQDVLELMDVKRQVEEELADDGRVVLRYSGTESLLRVMVEARNEDLVQRSVKRLVDAAKSSLGEV